MVPTASTLLPLCLFLFRTSPVHSTRAPPILVTDTKTPLSRIPETLARAIASGDSLNGCRSTRISDVRRSARLVMLLCPGLHPTVNTTAKPVAIPVVLDVMKLVEPHLPQTSVRHAMALWGLGSPVSSIPDRAWACRGPDFCRPHSELPLALPAAVLCPSFASGVAQERK